MCASSSAHVRLVLNVTLLYWKVIDTPGILDHPLEDRNTIEMQAITALAHLRAAILYFVDVSEQCGTALEQQVSATFCLLLHRSSFNIWWPFSWNICQIYAVTCILVFLYLRVFSLNWCGMISLTALGGFFYVFLVRLSYSAASSHCSQTSQ